MIIGDIKLSQPFMEYEAVVSHHTSRKSTAIEWLILELISKYSNNENYNAIPLTNLFLEIFKIPDADLLIKPCLLDLEDLRAITSSALYDQVSLKELTLRDLRLTDLGKEMQVKNLLPGEENEELVSVVYDVVDNKIMDSNFLKLSSDSLGQKIKEIHEESEVAFPAILIKNEFFNEKRSKKFPWLQPTTEIRDIRKGDGKVKWRNTTQKIQVTNDGLLSVAGYENDTATNSVLLESSLFNATDYDYVFTEKETFYNIDKEYSNVFLATKNNFEAEISDVINSSQVSMINEKNMITNKLSLRSNKQTRVLIYFDSNHFSFEEDEDIKIYVPIEFPVNHCIVYNKVSNVFASQFDLYNSVGKKQVVLGYRKNEVSLDTVDLVKDIIAKYQKYDIRVLCLYTLICDDELIFKEINKSLGDADLMSKIKNLDCIKKLVTSIKGSKVNWDKEKHSLIKDSIIDHEKQIKLDEFLTLVNKVRNIELYQYNKKLLNEIISELLSNIEVMDKHSDVMEIWRYLLDEKAVDKKWIQSNGKNEKIYTKEVLESLYIEILKFDYIQKEEIFTDYEKTFIRMRTVLRNLQKLMPEIQWSEYMSKETIYHTLINYKESIKNIREEILVWKDMRQKINNSNVSYDFLLENNAVLQGVEDFIERLTDALSLFLDEEFLGYDNIYILDTNVLMDTTDIFSLRSNSDLLIVPTVVLEELDGLKKSSDENRAFNAREAIRSIDEHTEDYKTANSSPELLVEDLSENVKDNLILSIALKHIVKSPMIITNDKNMRAIAKSQNIQVTDLNGFKNMKQQEKNRKNNGNKSKQKKSKKRRK